MTSSSDDQDTVFSEVRTGCVTSVKNKTAPFQFSNPNLVFSESAYTVSTASCYSEIFYHGGGSHAKLSRVWAPELAIFGISSMSWSVVKQVFAGGSDGKLFHQFCREQGRLRLSLLVLHAWPLTCPFTLVLIAPGLRMGYLLCLCHGVSCPGCVDCLACGVGWGPKSDFAV